MDTKEALNVLEMFLHKQCSLKRTEFAYDQITVWHAVNMATEALEASQWIPVSEGLPKKGESVLVTLNDDILSEWEHRDVNYVEIAWYDEKTDYYDGLHFFDSEWEKLDTVTAWMPLPKPYGVEE